MAAPPTCRLLPHFDCKPGGDVRLGAVLLESSKTGYADPDDAVAEVYVAPDPAAISIDVQDYDEQPADQQWEYKENIERTGKSSIFVDVPILSSIFASFNFERAREMGIAITCKRLETSSFAPTLAFKTELARKAKADPFIREYTWKRWRPWLYVVTGLKVAEQATIEYSWGKSLNAEGKIGFDASTSLVPVRLGLGHGHARSQHGMQSEAREGPFIVGYRLFRMRLKKDDGAFTETGDRRRGNFLYDDAEAEPSRDLEEAVDAWEFEEM